MSKTNFKKDKTKDKNQVVHVEKKVSTSSKDDGDRISLFGDKKEGGRGLLRKDSGKLSAINDSAKKSAVFSRFFHKDKKRIGKDGAENPELPEVVSNRKVILPEETQHVPSQLKTLTLPVQNSDSQKRWSSYEPLGRNAWEPIPSSITNSTVITSNRSLSDESLILTTNPTINNQYALSTTNLSDIIIQKNKSDIPPSEPSTITILDSKTDANIVYQNELKEKICELDNKLSKAFQERSEILKKICSSLKFEKTKNEAPLKGDTKFKVALGETFESLDVLNKYIIENLLVSSSQPLNEIPSTNKRDLTDIVCQLSSHIHQLNDIFNDNSLANDDDCLNSKSLNMIDCLSVPESNNNKNQSEKSNLVSLESYSSSETLIESSTPKLTDTERKLGRPDVADLTIPINLNITASDSCSIPLDPNTEEVLIVNQPIIDMDVTKGAKSPNSRILNICSLPSISEDKDEWFDAMKSPDLNKNQREETVFDSYIVLKIDDALPNAMELNSVDNKLFGNVKENLLLDNMHISSNNDDLLLSEDLSIYSTFNNSNSLEEKQLSDHLSNDILAINDDDGTIKYIDHSSIEDGFRELKDVVRCGDNETLKVHNVSCPPLHDTSNLNDISEVITHEIIDNILKGLKNYVIKDFDNIHNIVDNLEYRSPRSLGCYESEIDDGECNKEKFSLTNDLSFADDKISIESLLATNLSIDNTDSDTERLQNELLDLIPKTLNYDPQDDFNKSLPPLHLESNNKEMEDNEGLYSQNNNVIQSDVDLIPPILCDAQIPISTTDHTKELFTNNFNQKNNAPCISDPYQINNIFKSDLIEGKDIDIQSSQNKELNRSKDCKNNQVVLSHQQNSILKNCMNSDNSLATSLENNSLLSTDDNDNIEFIIEKLNNIYITSEKNTPQTSISDINLNVDINLSKDLSNYVLPENINSIHNSNLQNKENGLLDPVYSTNNQVLEQFQLANLDIDHTKDKLIGDSPIDIFPEKLVNLRGSISNIILKESMGDSMSVDIENMLNSDIKSSDIISSEDNQMLISENLNETIV